MCQLKSSRAKDTSFDMSILSERIYLAEFVSSDNDISSISSDDSLLFCSYLREKTMRFETKAV